MSISEINKLREHLNALINDETAASEEILQISRELDKLILQYLNGEDK